MYWIIKMYKDHDSYLDPIVINNRNPPFYTVQGHKKKGGHYSNRRG